MAVAILFMGIASPLFTRRMEASSDALLQQMQVQMDHPQNAAHPVTRPVNVLPPQLAGSPEKLTPAFAAVTAGGPGK